MKFPVAASGTEPLSYQWFLHDQPLDDASEPVLRLEEVQPPQAGRYTVRVSNAWGSLSAEAVLEMEPADDPRIRVPPANQTQPAGGTAILQVIAEGTAPLSYQWFHEGVALGDGAGMTGARFSALRLANLRPTQAGTYSVAVRNALGQASRAAATLSVEAGTAFVIAPARVETVERADVAFAVLGRPTEGAAFAWSFNGRRLSDGSRVAGASRATLNLYAVRPDQMGTYSVKVTDAGGASTANAVLLVRERDPRILVPPARQTVPEGASVVLRVEAAGTPPLSYQWRLNGIPLPGATADQLELSHVSLRAAGGYAVEVTGAGGSVISETAMLAVAPAAEPAEIDTQPERQVVNVGETVTFMVEASGSEPLFYQWRLNGVNLDDRPALSTRGVLSGATTATLTIENVQLADAGDYTALVQNAVNTAESGTAHLTVFDPPRPPPGPGPFSDAFAGERNALEAGEAVGTGDNTGAEAQLETDEPPHGGIRSSHSLWLTWRAPEDGIATLHTQGSNFDTVLAVYEGESLVGLTPVVADDDSGEFLTSRVSFTAHAGAEYQVAVAGYADQSGQIVLTVGLRPTMLSLPTITRQPASLTLMAGATADFSVEAKSTGEELLYQWWFNGEALPGATSNQLRIGGVRGDHVGRYRVVVSSSAGESVTSAEARLEIGPLGSVHSEDKFEDLFDPSGAPKASATLYLAREAAAGVPAAGPGKPEAGSFAASFSAGLIGSQLLSASQGKPQACKCSGNCTGKCCVIGDSAVWFLLRVAEPMRVKLDTEGSVETPANAGNRPAQALDTILALFRGTRFENMAQVQCQDDGPGGVVTAAVEFDAKPDELYAIGIDRKKGKPGNIQLRWQGVPYQDNYEQFSVFAEKHSGVLELDALASGITNVWSVLDRSADFVSVPSVEFRLPDSRLRAVRFFVQQQTDYVMIASTARRGVQPVTRWALDLRLASAPSVLEGLVLLGDASCATGGPPVPGAARKEVSWSGAGFELQTADSAAGPWQAVSLPGVGGGAANRFLLDPGCPSKFYRLNGSVSIKLLSP